LFPVKHLQLRSASTTLARSSVDIAVVPVPVESHGFLLVNGVLTTIDVPGAAGTAVQAVNDSGDIVGIYFANGTSHGFVYSRGVFSTIDFPAAGLTNVFGINNRGEIVGEYVVDRQNHGFLYSRGVFSTIDVPGVVSTAAEGINDKGQIVGAYHSGRESGEIAHGFLLSQGLLTSIDFPGAVGTDVFALNNSGDIVGRYQAVTGGDSHGFLLSRGTFTTIDAPFPNTLLFGINDRGVIVGHLALLVEAADMLRGPQLPALKQLDLAARHGQSVFAHVRLLVFESSRAPACAKAAIRVS
jgi:hypothetical protein